MTKKRKPQQSKTKNNPKQQPKRVVKSPVSNSFFTNKKLHLIILFVFGFLLYANTITHDYTQDDAIVITDNDFVKKGFSGIGEILGNDTFLGFFKVHVCDHYSL